MLKSRGEGVNITASSSKDDATTHVEKVIWDCHHGTISEYESRWVLMSERPMRALSVHK
jgi:hypothetical protein